MKNAHPPRLPIPFIAIAVIMLMIRMTYSMEPLESRQLLSAAAEMPWTKVHSFAYQLQNVNLTALGKSKFNAAVIDYSADGSDAGAYSALQINKLQHSPGGPKRILAYLSIGEAENYRWYWQKAWDPNHDGIPDKNAPAWLGPQNPDWAGNYKVKYWDPVWQKIVDQSLDRIIAAGFDAIYMDIVDAFEYWGPGGESGLNRPTAAADMVKFVEHLAHYARVTRGIKDFAIFAQNGEALSDSPSYVQTLTGIGEEDTFYNANHKQPASTTAHVVNHLKVFAAAGKTVFTIDYPTKQKLIDDAYEQSAADGFVPYVSDRELDRLTVNAGHEP